MPHEFKAGVIVEMFNVSLRASEQIVGTDHFVALLQQPIDKVRAKKAGTSGNKNSLT
jgi:hypothetical protein